MYWHNRRRKCVFSLNVVPDRHFNALTSFSSKIPWMSCKPNLRKPYLHLPYWKLEFLFARTSAYFIPTFLVSFLIRRKPLQNSKIVCLSNRRSSPIQFSCCWYCDVLSLNVLWKAQNSPNIVHEAITNLTRLNFHRIASVVTNHRMMNSSILASYRYQRQNSSGKPRKDEIQTD